MLDRGLRRLVELRCNYVNGFLQRERWDVCVWRVEAVAVVTERWE